jgi:hypothetical protein
LFAISNFNGRIPAYLLKPVPNLRSFENVFSNGGGINAYTTEDEPDVYRTIPTTFFTYTPDLEDLSSAFQHITLYGNPNNTFNVLKNPLDVSSIFYSVH